jgi:transcriptional regulator with XRE-family HTH domain
VRKRRDWSAADLAARCAALGAADLTENVIENIESRSARASKRPRPVTVDELLALALALDAPPLYLLVPPDGPDEPYPVTATVSDSRRRVAVWIKGGGTWITNEEPGLHRTLVRDWRQFYSELPEEEFYGITSSKKDEATS